MRLAAMTLVASLILLGCGKGSDQKSQMDEARRNAEAQHEREINLAAAKEKAAQELEQAVNLLIAMQRDLDRQMQAAEGELAAATSEAEREKASARLADIKRQQRESQAQMDKLRAGVKRKCPPDDPLC